MASTLFTYKVFLAIAFILPFLGGANAATLPNFNGKRSGPAPLALGFNVKSGNRSSGQGGVKSGQSKSAPSPVPLKNEDKISYLIDVSIGSDAQKVSVALDTGSSDFWVPGPDTGASDLEGGTYDPSKSSSSKDLGIELDDQYGIGQVSGEYYSDDVTLTDDTGIKLSNLQVGVASSLNQLNEGILGIGFESLEGTSQKYDNFPAALVKQGIISKNAYSLFLNSPTSSTGTIIFGGVDKAKYTGDLVALPIDDDNYLSVELDTIDIKGSSISFGDKALLDSGTTLAYVNTDVAEKFAKGLDTSGAETVDGQQYYAIDCGLLKSTDTFSFSFTKGAKINVPISEFVFQQDSKCYSAFVPQASDGSSDSNMAILGDVFLRSAYLVYDLDDKTISLAQAKYTNASNIVSL